MTEAEFAAIEARCAAATPGPWVAYPGEVRRDVGELPFLRWLPHDSPHGHAYDEARRQADAAFIAAARQDVPALLAEAGRLRAALSAVRNHWREFGPEHGFDETLEASCRGLLPDLD